MRNFLIITLLISTFNLLGQSNKSVNFSGYQQIIYQHPVKLPSGEWQAYYSNTDYTYSPGKITMDSTLNIFEITFNNGDKWTAKIESQKVVEEDDKSFGKVTKTIYMGYWTDINEEAKLVITLTKKYGCLTVMYSRRILDKEKNIDNYKFISTFATNGNCLE